MPFFLVHGDITKLPVDAIVNAANESLLGGGGVDGCIHRAAGPGLLAECRTLGGCGTGEAKITKGYWLPCKQVIHTVGPIWNGGTCGEKELLSSCYRSSLALATEYGCETVAFPLISSGIYGYPKDQALQVARSTIVDFLQAHDMTVFLVIFDRKDFRIDDRIFSDIAKTLEEPKGEKRDGLPVSRGGFLETLHELAARKGKGEAELCKRANMDRGCFPGICSHSSKADVMALAIALELDWNETEELLARAGYGVNPPDKFEAIIMYFITHERYDIFEVNEALFAFGQHLLGSKR